MSRTPDTEQDERLLEALRRDPDAAMPEIFNAYYSEVCRHLYRLIPVRETCEDIAQAIFLELWQKRAALDIRMSVGAYLYKMALSRGLNYIRDNRKFQHQPDDAIKVKHRAGEEPLQQLMDAELEEVISAAIDRLPGRCRLVFVLSRFEDLSYKEIAKALDISSKTVENQISKALQLLREALREYHRGNRP